MRFRTREHPWSGPYYAVVEVGDCVTTSHRYSDRGEWEDMIDDLKRDGLSFVEFLEDVGEEKGLAVFVLKGEVG